MPSPKDDKATPRGAPENTSSPTEATPSDTPENTSPPSEARGAPETPEKPSTRPEPPRIRKAPFIAYTLAAVATVYILAAPTTVSEFFTATAVAGLVAIIGYTSWSAVND